MKPSYYSQLGISDDASVDQIRKACGRAIARLKPRCDAGDPKAIAQMAEFKTAFEILSSASQRVEYDRSLRNGMMEDDDDDEAATAEYSAPFWNSSRIALAAFFAAAALMIGYYQREASQAEAAAAASAETGRKRADDLAAQLKAIKDKERAAAKVDSVAAARQAQMQAQIDEENKRMSDFGTAVNDQASQDALQAERRRARAALSVVGIDPDEVMGEDKDEAEKARKREKRLNEEKAAATREQRSAEDLMRRQNDELEEQRRKVLRIDPG
jgi:curved DNA-binding protein CbpA